MADQRVQIEMNDGTFFGGIVPDGLSFTSIDVIPDVWQTSYCGNLWRKKEHIVGIKVEDVIVPETNLGFVLRDDPTWPKLIKVMFGEAGIDIYDDYVTTNKDNAFLGGTVLYP